jgi:hypothetical protein
MMRYDLPSSPTAPRAIENPHFTYHPMAYFHLTAGNGGEEIFSSILLLEQYFVGDHLLPWVRATTAPIRKLPTGGPLRAADEESKSVEISLALLAPGVATMRNTQPALHFATPSATVQISAVLVPPQNATLSWFHDY